MTTQITPYTTTPSRQNPATFSADRDVRLREEASRILQMNALAVELNALAAAMTLNATMSTSTTSLAIGMGSKSLTVGPSKSYWPGNPVMIANSSSNWMHGIVTSYNSSTGALVVNVTNVSGSGTLASWTVTLSGPIALSGLTAIVSELNNLAGVVSGIASANKALVLGALKDIDEMAIGEAIIETLTVTNFINYKSSVRQTIHGGPVDTSGFPSFLPSTSTSLSLTTQNITSSAPLVVSAANGFNSNGEINNIGISISNLTWSSLTASATLYLYVTIANGILTTGFTALAPIYQFAGTPSVTNGQATYNIQEGKMYLGNGTSAVATNLVFVGEAVTGTSTVTSTVAYAYNGRYQSGYTSTLPIATLTSKNHRIGTTLIKPGLRLKCLTTEGNYTVGSIISHPMSELTSNVQAITHPVITSRNAFQFYALNFKYQPDQSTGGNTTLTAANWAYEMFAERNF